jgi:hypothetical protein
MVDFGFTGALTRGVFYPIINDEKKRLSQGTDQSDNSRRT